jgi:hypothetical protein
MGDQQSSVLLTRRDLHSASRAPISRSTPAQRDGEDSPPMVVTIAYTKSSAVTDRFSREPNKIAWSTTRTGFPSKR